MSVQSKAHQLAKQEKIAARKKMREEEEAEEEATRKKLAETHRRVSVSFPQLCAFSLLPYVLKYLNNPFYNLTLTNIIARSGGRKGRGGGGFFTNPPLCAHKEEREFLSLYPVS